MYLLITILSIIALVGGVLQLREYRKLRKLVSLFLILFCLSFSSKAQLRPIQFTPDAPTLHLKQIQKDRTKVSMFINAAAFLVVHQISRQGDEQNYRTAQLCAVGVLGLTVTWIANPDKLQLSRNTYRSRYYNRRKYSHLNTRRK